MIRWVMAKVQSFQNKFFFLSSGNVVTLNSGKRFRNIKTTNIYSLCFKSLFPLNRLIAFSVTMLPYKKNNVLLWNFCALDIKILFNPAEVFPSAFVGAKVQFEARVLWRVAYKKSRDSFYNNLFTFSNQASARLSLNDCSLVNVFVFLFTLLCSYF